MNTDHLLRLYNRTAQAYGRKDAIEGEWESWKTVLGGYTYGSVDDALQRWHKCTDVEDFTHRPMGARMPQPSEISLSIKRYESITRDDKKYKPTDDCWDGWRPVEPVEEGKKYMGRVKRCQCWFDWAARRKAEA